MKKRVCLLMLLGCLAVVFLAGSLGATSYYYQDLTKQGVPTGTDYYPNAINDARQIVGYSYEFSTTTYKAFLWAPGKGLLQLQTLGGKDCRAIAINKLGQIVGVADPSTGLSQACLWTDPLQAPTALGPLAGHTSSRAHAINDGGVIVGDSSGTFTHACKWTAPLAPTDLGTLGGSTSSAMGINNAGQIVGSATNSSGTFPGLSLEPGAAGPGPGGLASGW